jgi:hypothetical protein
MVGNLGCGCCDEHEPDVPPSCVECLPTTYNGALLPTDVTSYSDSFSGLDTGWRLGPGQSGAAPPGNAYIPRPPNSLSDYIRSSAAHAFKVNFPLFNFNDNNPFVDPRTCPPQPLPNTAVGRQPWIDLCRFFNVYLPKSTPRKYTWEVTEREHGPYLAVICNDLASLVVKNLELLTSFADLFKIRAEGLDFVSDEHPNASLKVYVGSVPVSGTTQNVLTVPFGAVTLRWELERLNLTGSQDELRMRALVNNTPLLDLTTSNSLTRVMGFARPQGNPQCYRACNRVLRLMCFEPWFGIWRWLPIAPGVGFWDRGVSGYNPLTDVYWHASNSPENELKYTAYSMTITNA